MKNKKVFALLSIFTIFASSLTTFTGKSAIADDGYFPSPSVDEESKPSIDQEEHEGTNYDGVIVQDGTDWQWCLDIDLTSYKEVIDNPDTYNDTTATDKNKGIYLSLVEVYDTEYCVKPVREFNPQKLNSDLAVYLSGNEDFDARNLCATYLFELTFGEDDEGNDITDLCLGWLYMNPDNYLRVNFHLTTECPEGVAPIILYKCEEEMQDPNNKTEPKWEVNDSGTIISEDDGNGKSIIQYKFYSLCPMMIVEAREQTIETELHPEWINVYPLAEKWIVPYVVATTGGLVLIALIVGFTQFKKKEVETLYDVGEDA